SLTVTLTFDNGPTHEVTPRVLDVLRDRGVRSTFFVVGEQLRAPGATAIARRAATEGHWIGNHTLIALDPAGRARGPRRRRSGDRRNAGDDRRSLAPRSAVSTLRPRWNHRRAAAGGACAPSSRGRPVHLHPLELGAAGLGKPERLGEDVPG